MSPNLIEEKDPLLLRLVYIVAYYIVLRFVDVVVAGIAIVQIVCVAVSGQKQEDLARFSGQLAEFIRQVIDYSTWRSDRKPYPFLEWPAPRDDEDASQP